MTVRQTAEVTVSDLTDAYSVTLSSYNATFQADTTKWTSGSTAVVVQAVCGSSQVDCSVPNTLSFRSFVIDVVISP